VTHEMREFAFASLTKVEILSSEVHCNNITKMLSDLDGPKLSDEEFNLRKRWLHVKYFVNMEKDADVDYVYVQSLINSMKLVLEKKSPTYTCHTAASSDSIISLATVKDKLELVEKKQSTHKVEDLYRNHEFKLLMEILEFSLGQKPDDCQDIKHRFYLTEAYCENRSAKCVQQCAKICEFSFKNRSDETLLKCVKLMKRCWLSLRDELTTGDTSILVNTLVQILIYVEKRKVENGFLLTEPWCLLHSILLNLEKKEPAFYIEEDSVPNSILLLQLGHEVLSQNSKCCLEQGHLLRYTMDQLLELRQSEEYWSCEETKTCFEQSVLCLYCHPNKKYKLKYLKDHGSSGIELDWAESLKLFDYYKFDVFPEFDTNNKRITAEVENLFQRIVVRIPEEIKAEKEFNQMKDYVEGSQDTKPVVPQSVPQEVADLYYLLADSYFKSKDAKDFDIAVEFYTRDLAVRPNRFDSWAAIALAKALDIYSNINACVRLPIDELILKSEAVVRCFREALILDEGNNKLRIEFGSFLYSIHSVFSRELKLRHEQLRIELFQTIDEKKSKYLLEALKWFEPYTCIKDIASEETDHEEVWINHYMLGKVTEKLHPNDPKAYLTQYELAGKLLHEQGALYPARISYYNPPDSSLEALEIYYR
jgi:hypothetical protein